MSFHRFVIPLFGVLAACGGKTDNQGDAGEDGYSLDGFTDSAPPGPDCPVSLPTQGSSCSKDKLQCEYGGDPRWTCNTVVSCTSGIWDVLSQSNQSCPSKSAPQCPASINDIQQGASCTPSDIMCNYSTAGMTSFCSCTHLGGPIQVDGGTSASWYCTSSGTSGCPLERPRIGSTCAQPALECDYSVCGVPSGLDVTCDATTSTWAQGFGGVCAGAN